MNEFNRRITVLIPTLNRCETLARSLETCVRQEDSNLQILVSDNVSQDETKAVVDRFIQRDSRVKYINPGRRLGMSEHWEFALEQIPDGMVIVIGDDDGLLPCFAEKTREYLREFPDVLSIKWPYSVFYYPDLPEWEGIYRLPAGYLGLKASEGIEFRRYRNRLEYAAAGLGGYSSLPGLYHCLIDMSILHRFKSDTGKMMHSVSPDIYTSVSLSNYLDRFLFLKSPLSLLGVSKKSTGFNQLMVDSHKRDIPQKHLSESEIKFHRDIAYLPNIPIFIAEALTQAKEVGCLPPEMKINWDNFIIKAHSELS